MQTETKYYTDYKFEVEEKSDGALIFNEVKFKNEEELLKYLTGLTDGAPLYSCIPYDTWNTMNYLDTEEEETILSFNVSDIK